MAQVDGFKRGRQRADGDRTQIKLSMLIMAFVTESRQQTDALVQHALGRHRRFLNVFGTGGDVTAGAIKPYDFRPDRRSDRAEPGHRLRRTWSAEKIAQYAALGIDNLQLNMNFGAPHEQVMRSLELFATQVDAGDTLNENAPRLG